MNTNKPRIGVYICHCGINIAQTVDVEIAAEYAQKLPGVVIAKHYVYMCSDPGQDLIRNDIKEYNLNRVVVASCTPSLHKITFSKVLESAGLNPFMLEVANIREQCSWVHKDKEKGTKKAKDLIAAAVAKVAFSEPLEIKHSPVKPAVLIIGAGIAGMQSALDIANGGYEVHLVEKGPSVGGKMAQLDKTFPTLDCASCILTPKMSEVGRHPHIKLHTYSEVIDVQGYVGNFDVKIKHHPTYVDWNKCTGCNLCADACPVEIPDEFNQGMNTRKAAYRLFPQAVPNKFLIDKRGVPACNARCPIHLNAFGYVSSVRAGDFERALKIIRKDKDFVFAGTAARVCTHPCEDGCKRKELDKKPISIREIKRFVTDWEFEKYGEPQIDLTIEEEKDKHIGIIGAGPAGLTAAFDLRKKGYKVTVFDSLPAGGGMLLAGIPEYRLPKKILKKEVEIVEKVGVDIRYNTKIGKDIPFRDILKGFDVVYVATGAHRSRGMGIPGEDLESVHHGVNILRRINLGEKVELGKRVIVVGGGNSAMDAARSALRLGAEVTILYRRSKKEMPAIQEEVEAAISEGIKVELLRNPVEFIGENGRLKRVKVVKMELGEPDASGRRRPVPIEGSEYEISADDVLLAIGEKPDVSFLEGTDIKLTSWGSIQADEITFQTSNPKVFAGGDAVTGPATFIDAVAHGKRAAISIDRYLNNQDLYSGREGELPYESELMGDTKFASKISRIEKREIPVSDRIKNFEEVELTPDEGKIIQEAGRCLGCGGCAECMRCVDACEAKAIMHDMVEKIEDVEVGAIIVATGFDLFDARRKPEFGYGKYPNVITAMELERLLSSSGPTNGELVLNGKIPKNVAFIQCVGSRDKSVGVEYCSRICCMYTVKEAHLIKERIPDARITVFYMDIRAFGKGFEEFYDRVRREGIIYRRGNPSEVFKKGDKLVVKAEDTILGEQVEEEVDLVVLAIGVQPNKNTEEIRKILKLSRSPDGFLLEAHPKMRPVDTAVDGVFLAGTVQGPKDIPDTVSQAKAASSSVLSIFARGEVEISPVVAFVDEEVCAGCLICKASCEFSAIDVNPITRKSEVNAVLCKGCGACAAVCPSGAMQLKEYTPTEVFSYISKLV